MRKTSRSRKKGPVQSKKVSYDGIDFASGLEKFMYISLREAGIKFKYEGETFVLLNGFHFDNDKQIVKVIILIEVKKEYYQLNIRQIL